MVRHTDVYNPGDIVYGRLPRFRLSDLGREQAQRTAAALSAYDVSAMYASPQLRARQTAEILNATLGLGHTAISSLIAEVRTHYESRSYSSMKGISFYNPLAHDDDETIVHIARRMIAFVRMVRRRHSGHTTIGVSHADPIMILNASLRGRPLLPESLNGPEYPEKGSITEIRYLLGTEIPTLTYQNVAESTPPPIKP